MKLYLRSTINSLLFLLIILSFLFTTTKTFASSFTITNFTMDHVTRTYSFDYSGYVGGDISTESVNFGDIAAGSYAWQLNHEPANCTGGSTGFGTCSGTANYSFGTFSCTNPVWIGIYGYHTNPENYVTGLTNPDPSCFSPTEDINLNVPLLKQTDSIWGGQEYDSANKWSPNPTISAWGCALTSTAMVFNYHGIEKLPDGTTLDPGSLNTWLKKQKDGYVGKGLVNWLALSRLSKLAINTNNITTFDALEFKKKISSDKTLVKADLKNQIPDILGEPGHFIVARGIENDIITINDPAYNRNLLTEGYNNTFNSINKFSPSFTDLSYIMLTIDPNIDIALKDSNGTEVGESFIEEPISSFYDNTETNGDPLKIVYFEKPPADNYEIFLSSQIDTDYQLGIYLYDIDGEVFTKIKKGNLLENENSIIPIIFNPQINFYPKKISFGKMRSHLNKSYREGKISNYSVFETLSTYFNQAFDYKKQKREDLSLESLKMFENVLYEMKEYILDDAFNTLFYDVNYLATHL